MVKETYKLVNAVKKMYPVVQFFKDRYFPDGRVFYSSKALIEGKKQGRKAAPFVIPVVGGIVMESRGYKAYEVEAPYIAPKMPITAGDLEKKAFGESPESGRTPAERENEVQSEHMDDLRLSILRRHELMCSEIITQGQIFMKHFATAEDAAKDMNYQVKVLRFFEGEFKNRYCFTKEFQSMSAGERIQEFFKMATVLQKRHVRATDVVMTSDVSMLLMSDEEFLEFFNKAKAEMGSIKPEELPDGVVCNGMININGVMMTLFTYEEDYEDLDGSIKPILPKGTLAFLRPEMGETVYAQVTVLENGGFKSYADKIVPRVLHDERENTIEVQAFSRPVPYPYDWESWLVANIYAPVVSEEEAENSVDLDEEGVPGAELKSVGEIDAMTKKSDVIAYAESIGLSGLDNSMRLDDLKSAVLNYQEETYGE